MYKDKKGLTVINRFLCIFGIFHLVGLASAAGAQQSSRPNFIVVVTDDQGYNDLGCFGSRLIKTPYIDKMASEGLRLTSYYNGAPLCAPSRASFMTGCYSQRIAELRNKKGKRRFHPILDASEILLPEILKKADYSTCAIGKWHLAGGSKGGVAVDESKQGLEQYSLVHPEVMPRQKGFDHYFGIPYSNDMNPVVLMRDNGFVGLLGKTDKQSGISTRYTDEALAFIERTAGEPFFLYLAHSMPHTPLYPHSDFAGKSAYGLYGDCIEEIDWNVGRILDKLEALGIGDNTFVIFTSDNGPWIEQNVEGRNNLPTNRSRNQGGRADPLRGFKMTTHEGGPRVPCVMRFPNHIPAGGVTDEVVASMDILPTFVRLAGAQLPDDRVIDGVDVMDLLCGVDAKSPRESYYFYKWTHLHGVRSGNWKLVLPREARPKDLGWYNRLQEEVTELTLYNLRDDIGETINLTDEHPEVVERLVGLIESAQIDLGDGSRGIEGTGVR
jgi:arylsulfatase A-like enzyme